MEVRQVAETFGMMPFGWDMFNIPRSDHGWMTVVGQELGTKRLVYLPTGNPVLSVDEAFSRPDGVWFPTMRWRQFWHTVSNYGDAANKVRERFCQYFCRTPPNDGRRLERIQFFWTANPLGGWDEKVKEWPDAQPSRVVNWFCTQELVDRMNAKQCPECDENIISTTSGTEVNATSSPPQSVLNAEKEVASQEL